MGQVKDHKVSNDQMNIGVCCETETFDKSGLMTDDFKSESTDVFTDPKILGTCATSQKVSKEWMVTKL